MTRRPRPLRLLTVGDVLGSVVDHLAELLFGPRCPICGDRYQLVDVHVSFEHYPGEH